MKSALEAGLSLGRSISGVRGPLRPWRERLLRDIFAAGDTLRLQFPCEDLGFIYNAPGAAIDTSSGASFEDHQPDKQPADRVSRRSALGVQQLRQQQRNRPYEPSTLPGARLPHFEIALLGAVGEAHAAQQCISTHDLMPYTSTEMQLWLSGGQASSVWAEAAVLLQQQEVPVSIVHICNNCEEAEVLLGAQSERQRANKVTVALDISQQWQHLREVCLSLSSPPMIMLTLQNYSEGTTAICQYSRREQVWIGLAGDRSWCNIGASGWACGLASCLPSHAIFPGDGIRVFRGIKGIRSS